MSEAGQDQTEIDTWGKGENIDCRV